MDLAQVKLPRFVLTIFLNALRIGNVHIGIKKKKKSRKALSALSQENTIKIKNKSDSSGFSSRILNFAGFNFILESRLKV